MADTESASRASSIRLAPTDSMLRAGSHTGLWRRFYVPKRTIRNAMHSTKTEGSGQTPPHAAVTGRRESISTTKQTCLKMGNEAALPF